MIDGVTILDEIERLLMLALPECGAVSIGVRPQDAGLPGVLLQYTGREDTPVNSGTSKRAHSYLITLNDGALAPEEADPRRLLRLCERVMGVFEPGYLRVEDRAPGVKAKAKEWKAEQAVIELTVTYNTELEQAPQPPMMNELNLKLEEE